MAEAVERGEYICPICPHHCRLAEGRTGRCRVRTVRDGKPVALSYGVLSAVALDPIEKKPLRQFHPGSYILSVGSFGCNLTCPFCQNHEIAQTGVPDDPSEVIVRATRSEGSARHYELMSPEQLAALAVRTHIDSDNIGIAYTYNEPLVSYEYVRDTAKRVRAAGLCNVLVTNGCVTDAVADELLPYIDAMNIDLKCFTDEGYRRLGGDFETVKAFIRRAAKVCHVEVTTLVAPGLSDDEDDMKREAQWLAEISPELPLHITRFFPRYRMTDAEPTPIDTLERLADIARKHLRYVYIGNV